MKGRVNAPSAPMSQPEICKHCRDKQLMAMVTTIILTVLADRLFTFWVF